MTARIRKPGEFCWINILTPDPVGAKAFFSEVLGWTYDDIPGMGNLIKVGESLIGGLFDLDAPQTPAGTLPGIGVMVKVENVDAMSARIVELGGTTRPPFDIGDRGRMADCTDPNGAAIDLWQPNAQPGTDVDPTLHGAPSWFETMTTDATRATQFYAALFGWTPEIMPMPGFDYTTFKLGGEPIAGMMQITPDMGPMPPHWGVYFTVDDVDATERNASERGGTIFMPSNDIEGVGRMCGIISPQGVMFYVIRYLPMD